MKQTLLFLALLSGSCSAVFGQSDKIYIPNGATSLYLGNTNATNIISFAGGRKWQLVR